VCAQAEIHNQLSSWLTFLGLSLNRPQGNPRIAANTALPKAFKKVDNTSGIDYIETKFITGGWQVALKGRNREAGANPARTRRCNRGRNPQKNHCLF
jgi:hypothetical protein